MRDWKILIESISNVIKSNGNQEITGEVLKSVLINIVNSIGHNATFSGIATQDTSPGISDGPVFYIAIDAGEYPNFSGIVVNEDEVAILVNTETEWNKIPVGIYSGNYIKGNYATKKELVNSVQGLSQSISSVGTLAGNNSARINSLEKNVTSNTGEIGNINTKISVIEQDVKNNQSSIIKLDDEKATKQELANSAQGLGQAISSVGALAGNNSKDISDLKNNKANYTDIVDGTIVAGRALLAEKALNAGGATNADFAARAGQAMMADTAALANAAQTAYNVKAENVEGVLTEDQLPPYPTDMTMEITDYRELATWHDVENGDYVGVAISKIASNVRITKEYLNISQVSHIGISNSGLSPSTALVGNQTLVNTGGHSTYCSLPLYIKAGSVIDEISGASNVFFIAKCQSDILSVGDTIDIIKISISSTDRRTKIEDGGYYCFGYSVDDDNYDVTVTQSVSKFDTKQDKLVSGENIKTINGKSLLGSGNLEIEGLSDDDKSTINNLIELYEYTRPQAESNDFDKLPLLCGQPMILFGKGTPSKDVVPDNWKQYNIETEEGYNWNGLPSALGQQYINTTATSGGRYIAVPSGYCSLRWVNF